MPSVRTVDNRRDQSTRTQERLRLQDGRAPSVRTERNSYGLIHYLDEYSARPAST